MKKIFLTFLAPALILTFLMPQFVEAQAVTGTCTWNAVNKTTGARRPVVTQGILESACRNQDTPTETWTKVSFSATGTQKNDATIDNSDNPGFWDGILQTGLATIIGVILKFVALLTTISGVLLNAVIYYTVVEVSNNYSRLTPIMEAWRVLRDIANMTFIFVLLYAAIRTILGQGEDNKRVIVSVVVVAALMNFSLFFTRIVIDIANVFAITFYDAIAPGALNATGTLQGWGIAQAGLSNAFMEYLSLTTLYKMASTIDLNGLVMVGLMGSILLLIAAFVFFAIALMFIIRYVVLILVMILSPLYFISWALPSGVGLGKYKKQWEDALFGQAFFAPIYFLLTWVAIKVMSGMSTAFQLGPAVMADEASLSALSIGNTLSSGAFLMFMNFAIVIVLMIASLIVAKEWAGKGGLGTVTSWATKAAGNSLGGGVGWIGRKTVGKGGEWVSTRTDVQEWANKETGLKGAAGRLALYAGKKARSGTFDARNATVPTSAIGAAIEGTLGRTKYGKKFGLDEVRIKSIPIGAIAADQTGAGQGGKEGYREEQAAKAKRMNAAKKAGSDEYRLVAAQAAIDTVLNKDGSTKTTATPAQITEMQKVVKDMTTKEVAALNANTLSNEKVAEALTVNHLKAIEEDKDSKFSEEEKDKIFRQHFARVNTAVEKMANAAVWSTLAPDEQNRHKNAIRNISNKEMDYVPASIFDPNKLSVAGPEGEKSRKFLGTLLFPQVEELLKGEKLLAHEKAAVREERERPLKEAFVASRWTNIGAPAGTPKGVKEIMQDMPEPALVNMEANYTPATHNAPSLNHPEVVGIYTPSVLNKMAGQAGFGAPKRNALRKAIIDKVNADPILSAALANLVPGPGRLRITAADRQAALLGLNDEQKRLVTSAEWLESENGQQIF